MVTQAEAHRNQDGFLDALSAVQRTHKRERGTMKPSDKDGHVYVRIRKSGDNEGRRTSSFAVRTGQSSYIDDVERKATGLVLRRSPAGNGIDLRAFVCAQI